MVQDDRDRDERDAVAPEGSDDTEQPALARDGDVTGAADAGVADDAGSAAPLELVEAEAPLAPVADAELGLPDIDAAVPVAPPAVSLAGATRRGVELKPGQERRRLMKVGRVVSDKMNKTVIVAVEYTRPHPLYKKPMKRTSKFAAHDEGNQCRIGDVVRIEETRPLSRTKRWIVREVLQRAVVVYV